MNQEFLNSAPVVVLSFLAVLGIVVDALIAKSEKITFIFSTLALLASAALAALTFSDVGVAFNGMIRTGGYSSFFDVLFCAGGVLTLFAARPYIQRENVEHDEFYSLITLSVAGMQLIAHSNNLLNLFIGIEVMSVSFYVLAGYFRSNIKSVESALKYFLLGAFATGFLVYGMALIYGATGSLEFSAIKEVVQAATITFPTLLFVGVGLLLVGLMFKVAAFPFHQWVPDVYEGSPTVVTAFMSTAGKAASLSALIPVMAALVPSGFDNQKIILVVAIVSAMTMMVGNISAVVQTNVKRMLAYSSVAHAGYLLMGFVANNPKGTTGVMFYATAYLFMQLGAFVVVSLIEKHAEKNLQLEDYAGLSKQHPMLAALMALFMFSLAGIPPMAGFFGKYYLIAACVESGYTWLAIVAVISSMISVYFYIGLVVLMYFKDSVQSVEVSSAGLAKVTLIVSTVMVLLLGFFPSIVESFAIAAM